MHTLAVAPEILNESTLAATKTRIEQAIDNVMGSLPKPDQLSSEERRGMIARYTAVLEGNFIYWMTAAYLSVQSEEARPIIIDNLLEEVRDSHPAMLRRFAIAAGAMPTKEDALAINDELTRARLFFGKLSGVQTLVAMASLKGSSRDTWHIWLIWQSRKARLRWSTQTFTVFATSPIPRV